MGIHDRYMSLHLLDLDEPVQSPFEENLVDTGHAVCLCEEQCEGRLEISRKTWIDVGLEIGTLEARTRIVNGDHISFSVEIIADSRLLAFPEKCCQIRDPRMLDLHMWLSSECAQYDKCSTLDIVSDHIPARHGRMCSSAPIDDDMMVIGDIDLYSETSQEFDQTDDMWLDRTELDRRPSCSKCCNHEDILCGSHGEIPSYSDILAMITSLECDIFSLAHVLVSVD